MAELFSTRDAHRMLFREAFPIIYTAELSRALEFYRDVLGMTETFRFPAEDEPEFISLTLSDRSGLALAQSGVTPAPHGLPLRPGGHSFELCVYTDDVDAAVAAARAAGHAILYEPTNQPWHERMAYVADPDGNAVMICERLTDDAPPAP